jgi:hypothetical protein
MHRNFKTGEPTPQDVEEEGTEHVKEAAVLDEAEKLAIESSIHILSGGSIENMYTTFWALLYEAKEACVDPSQKAAKLANGHTMRNFLTSTEHATKVPSFASSGNVPAAFRALSPQIRNLLMAVGEINMKISHQEEVLSENLSNEHSKAARAGAACITHVCKQIENIQGKKNDKVNTLYRTAISDLLGAKYAAFTVSATNALQRWSETATQVSQLALEHPWILAFESIRQGADIATPEGLMASLMGARRQAEYVLDGLQSITKSETAVADTKVLDEKIGLRLQKHDISKQRYSEMSNRDPIELAEALRYLHLADSEIETSLNATESTASVVKVPADLTRVNTLRTECIAQIPVLTQISDAGHILQAEATRLKSIMTNQVVGELRLDVQSAIAAAGICLETCKTELKKTYERSLSQQESVVAELRKAERILAVEISAYSKGDGTNLELCAKAMAQATRDRRQVRDVHTFNQHKKILHSLMLGVKSALLTMK